MAKQNGTKAAKAAPAGGSAKAAPALTAILKEARTRTAAKAAPALTAILKEARTRTAKAAKVPAPVPAAVAVPAPAGVKKNGDPKLPAKHSAHESKCECQWCRKAKGLPHQDECKCKKCKDKREGRKAAAAVKTTVPAGSTKAAKGAGK
jgi:hypothetical protein